MYHGVRKLKAISTNKRYLSGWKQKRFFVLIIFVAAGRLYVEDHSTVKWILNGTLPRILTSPKYGDDKSCNLEESIYRRLIMFFISRKDSKESLTLLVEVTPIFFPRCQTRGTVRNMLSPHECILLANKYQNAISSPGMPVRLNFFISFYFVRYWALYLCLLFWSTPDIIWSLLNKLSRKDKRCIWPAANHGVDDFTDRIQNKVRRKGSSLSQKHRIINVTCREFVELTECWMYHKNFHTAKCDVISFGQLTAYEVHQ